MPPAFVLSQNQTLKLMYDPSPGGIAEAKTGISGSRSCTNIQTGVFAYEDIWNGINLTDRPIPRGYRRPGRRPHVPSSKTDNVKEPTRILPRFDWFRASAIPTKKRHETNARPVAEPRPLAEGGIYVWGPAPSTGYFATLLQLPDQLGSVARPWRNSPSYAQDRSKAALFKAVSICNRLVFRRSGYRLAWPPPRPRCIPSGASPGRRSTRYRQSSRPRPPANDGSAAASSAPTRSAPPCRAKR